jgi:colanic acid biosynthesis protein WcaH
MLSEAKFLGVVESAPLIAIDLVIIRSGKEVLLGLRNNRPARDFWFVPGGRVRKNETFTSAFLRIGQSELGQLLGEMPSKPMGVFEHFYQDCFSENTNISTHYVVMAYQVNVLRNFDVTGHDEQHANMRWWPLVQAASDESVHANTRAYFSNL